MADICWEKNVSSHQAFPNFPLIDNTNSLLLNHPKHVLVDYKIYASSYKQNLFSVIVSLTDKVKS